MHKLSLSFFLRAAAAAVALVVAASAKAAITYEYTTYAGNSPVTEYSFTPGMPLTIPIYLHEQLTGGSTSLITADGGLVGAAFSVTQTSNTGSGTLTSVAASVTGNGSNFAGGFSNMSGKDSSTFQGLAEVVSVFAASGPVPDANGDIEIGSITITTNTPNTYVLANYNYPSTKSDDLTGTFGNGPGASIGGFDLDPNNSGTYAYTGAIANPETIILVPEPGTVGLLGISSLALLARRRRTVM